MIVKLSLGLSWFPLPPDNVLPGQGVTSLATCHMTALIRGLKARGRPGRAGANPGVIGPSDCSQRREGSSPGSPPSAPDRQPHAPCWVLLISLRSIVLGPQPWQKAGCWARFALSTQQG